MRWLAPLPRDQLPAPDRAAFDTATREFVASQRYNADQPEARAARGSFQAARGENAAAERELRVVITMEPSFVPAYIDLADLKRSQRRNYAGRPAGRFPEEAQAAALTKQLKEGPAPH